MYYKFLHSRDVDRVIVDGTLMVSSLSYFRGLEETAGDIGDRLEGSSKLTIRDPMVVTEQSPELAMLNAANIGLGLFEQFAKVESGGQIKFGAGVSFVHLTPDFYIYSFSEGDLAQLTEEMCVNAPMPYDACLLINDPVELGRTCLLEGEIKNLNGCPAWELFELVATNPIEYVSRVCDITEGKTLTPDPFKKSERFRHQMEARLLFAPYEKTVISEQRLVFTIPEPTRHFEVVFRNQ